MKSTKIFLYRRILKLALPAIAGLSSQIIVSLVDTALVGRLSEAKYALAAMGIGVLATWALVSFFSSLATGTHVLIARRYGAGDDEGCGRVLNTSIITNFMIGLVVAALGFHFAFSISNFFAADNKVGLFASEYLKFRFLGIPFFLITVAYRGYYFGIGKIKVFMYSGIIINLLNVIFSYIFIYGKLGLPALGLAGAGIGASLATFCDSLFYFMISLAPQYRKKFRLFVSFTINWQIFKNILKIALPVSFQNAFLLIGFLGFIAVTGLVGTAEQAASQAVISILFISFMPCFGFGIAVQTLVGNHIGSGKPDIARMYSILTAQLATIYTVSLGLIFILLPGPVLHIITNDQTVISAALPVLRIAGFAQMFYSTGIVLSNALQAAGKTLFVMMAEVVSNWLVLVPLSYFLGIYLKFGLTGAWSAMPMYIVIYTIIIYLKFRNGSWKMLKQY